MPNIVDFPTKRRKAKPIYKRPYATHYFAGAADDQPSYSTQGACTTELGAIRATVPTVFDGSFAKAEVIDRETMAVIYTIKHGSKGLQVAFGRRDEQEEEARRRVQLAQGWRKPR